MQPNPILPVIADMAIIGPEGDDFDVRASLADDGNGLSFWQSHNIAPSSR